MEHGSSENRTAPTGSGGGGGLPPGGLRSWIQENHGDLLKAILSIARPLAGTPKERLEVALEILDETVLTALGKEAEYDPTRAVPGVWLAGFARLIVRRRLSRRDIDRGRVISADAPLTGQDGDLALRWESLMPYSGGVTADPVGEAVIRRQWIDGMMGRLSDGDRQVIRLFYFEGMAGPELAAALGVTEGTARVRLCRAMQRMSALAMADEETTAALLSGRRGAEKEIGENQ